MAAEFPDRKQQLVFLINNYDMMLAVLTVREREGGRERDGGGEGGGGGEGEREEGERERELKRKREGGISNNVFIGENLR